MANEAQRPERPTHHELLTTTYYSSLLICQPFGLLRVQVAGYRWFTPPAEDVSALRAWTQLFTLHRLAAVAKAEPIPIV